MMADVDQANLIWQQAGVQFTLLPGGYVDDDQYLDSNSDFKRASLRDWLGGTDGFEVYYVPKCTDQPDMYGQTSLAGIVMCSVMTKTIPAAVNNVLSHELGHAQGLKHFCAGQPDPPDPNCDPGKTGLPGWVELMYLSYVTGLQADITVGELPKLTVTKSQ